MGAVPSPFDCYLVVRGVKTLAIRMERHCSNARAVVQMLNEHPAVARVLYPGLPGHPGHDVARPQMRHFGGMPSFLAALRPDPPRVILGPTPLVPLALSLSPLHAPNSHPP